MDVQALLRRLSGQAAGKAAAKVDGATPVPILPMDGGGRPEA